MARGQSPAPTSSSQQQHRRRSGRAPKRGLLDGKYSRPTCAPPPALRLSSKTPLRSTFHPLPAPGRSGVSETKYTPPSISQATPRHPTPHAAQTSRPDQSSDHDTITIVVAHLGSKTSTPECELVMLRLE
ncbi:hypothetical protein BCV69DRAFT_25587 [Microstroma glucosiphilum]|uniref:Uncharacterized protein n=1 Tax=Pseudomicrostroma glucosiphilum TaxID=1684307 RepID=A0A316UGG7_9BASI|nr:hypothetical protein BCV69DRAFT_25587 [Pseudomicrostroma glucosiphilum]PWN24300.1 hypothetical protein BCV69DRAFT_25587 [Pseudomicrostroma glucosiphilum]